METILPAEAAPVTPPEVRPTAPAWHTIALIVVLALFSIANAATTHHATTSRVKITQYLLTIAWEFALVAYMWWGGRMRGVKLREVIGGRWERVEDFLIDVVIALGFWLGALLVLGTLAVGLGLSSTHANEQLKGLEEARKQLGFLVPRTQIETILWVVLSVSAGFCEEIVFRGYLQRQFRAWTGNAILGILLSGIVFGGGHGYEGGKRMIVIAVFGILFGSLAHLKKSLRPGMMAHALHDTAAGLILKVLLC